MRQSHSHNVEAKEALQKTFRQLEGINPTAARSLEEGLEETLTVHRLGLGAALRRKLATDQPDRIVIVDGAAGGAKRKALARRKSAFALDRHRTAGSRKNL